MYLFNISIDLECVSIFEIMLILPIKLEKKIELQTQSSETEQLNSETISDHRVLAHIIKGVSIKEHFRYTTHS